MELFFKKLLLVAVLFISISGAHAQTSVTEAFFQPSKAPGVRFRLEPTSDQVILTISPGQNANGTHQWFDG